MYKQKSFLESKNENSFMFITIHHHQHIVCANWSSIQMSNEYGYAKHYTHNNLPKNLFSNTNKLTLLFTGSN